MLRPGLLLVSGVLGLLFGSVTSHADLVISTDPTQNMTCSGGVCSPTDHNAVLNIDELTNLLAARDVTVTTIIFKRRNAHKLHIRAALSWTSTSKLTLTTYFRPVFVEAPVSLLGQGGLIVTHELVISKDTPITFWDAGSTFSINGQIYTLIGDIPTFSSLASADPKGHYALANDLDSTNDVFKKIPVADFDGIFLGLSHKISNLTVPKGHKLCEGMIGRNSGFITDVSLANVSVKLDKKSRYVGGLVGCNRGDLRNVSVSGHVTRSSYSDAGGIAGTNAATISGARSLADVTGGEVGGIVGENKYVLDHASAGGAVIGRINTGGLGDQMPDGFGFLMPPEACPEAKTTLAVLWAQIMARSQPATLWETLAAVPVPLVAFNNDSIRNAYATGTVSGVDGYTGGLAGSDPNEMIQTTYWDMESSGISDPSQGAGYPKYDPGIVGLTTAELKSGVPFGFSKHDWQQDPDINNGYPYLRANPPQ